jgi:hypothetical protein
MWRLKKEIILIEINLLFVYLDVFIKETLTVVKQNFQELKFWLLS